MTKETLIKSMILLSKTFKDFKAHEDKQTIAIWFEVFKDEDDILFQSAIKVCIISYQYSDPKISNINKYLSDLKNGDKMLPGDVYEEIQNAIRYRKNVSELSSITQQVIKGMGGMTRLGMSTNQDFDRTQILKMAETYIERDADDKLLTNSLKREQLANKEKLKMLSNKIGKEI